MAPFKFDIAIIHSFSCVVFFYLLSLLSISLAYRRTPSRHVSIDLRCNVTRKKSTTRRLYPNFALGHGVNAREMHWQGHTSKSASTLNSGYGIPEERDNEHEAAELTPMVVYLDDNGATGPYRTCTWSWCSVAALRRWRWRMGLGDFDVMQRVAIALLYLHEEAARQHSSCSWGSGRG